MSSFDKALGWLKQAVQYGGQRPMIVKPAPNLASAAPAMQTPTPRQPGQGAMQSANQALSYMKNTPWPQQQYINQNPQQPSAPIMPQTEVRPAPPQQPQNKPLAPTSGLLYVRR